MTEAWLLLLVARLSLRWLDLARCKRLLAAILPRARRETDEPTRFAAVRLRHWIVIAAANHLSSLQCLERALVLAAMLSRRGHDAELRIGVRRLGTELEAHAWVESGGRPITDDALETGDYSVLLPAAGTH